LLAAPSTDPGVRNYRTGPLPCVMTANMTDDEGCTMWACGIHRWIKRLMRFHFTGPF